MESTSKNDSMKIVQRFWDEVWAPPYNIDIVDSIVSLNTVTISAGKEIKGRANFKNWLINFHKLLIDAKLEPLDMFSNETGDKIVTRFILSGKNGGLFGLPPDYAPVKFTGISIWTIENNLLTNQWVERSGWETYSVLTSAKSNSI
ncbi:ester cyclase [[Eubacterium] cellulosolvens]